MSLRVCWHIASRFVSSAKWCFFKFFINQLKSFMFMRNNKGPMMEPYYTPYLMVWDSDLSLLRLYTEFCC